MDKILIVDDDATLAMELEEYLPTIGYEVQGVAASGLEAIKMARTLKPDLILMDIQIGVPKDFSKPASLTRLSKSCSFQG